jgi:3-oxoacyl-[acyl-carrier-protein] synthase-3
VNYAAVGPIAVHLPERVETNAQLKAEFPGWDMDLIYEKTGIGQRHIAAPDECSSDLAVKAAQRLFAEHDVDPRSIDFLLLCTQTPDYPLPTTACLLQSRLGLRTNVGALDFNLGCSGFVYGLSLADGLIRGGSAKRVLLLTAETYSKYIDKADRSLRTIFGDGAAATLIEAAPEPTLAAFQFGTDGTGADTLLCTKGGLRQHGLLDDPNPDRPPPPRRATHSRHAKSARRLRRRLVVGGMCVAGDVGVVSCHLFLVTCHLCPAVVQAFLQVTNDK